MAFKRREGLAGGGITRYVDNNMPSCPFCGKEHPGWLSDAKIAKYSLIAAKCMNSYQFQCPHCGGVFEIQAHTDFNFQNESFGKISLLSLGNGTKNANLIGKDVTLVQLKEMCSQNDGTISFVQTPINTQTDKVNTQIYTEAKVEGKDADKSSKSLATTSVVVCSISLFFVLVSIISLISSLGVSSWRFSIYLSGVFSILSFTLSIAGLLTGILGSRLTKKTALSKTALTLSIVTISVAFLVFLISMVYCSDYGILFFY